MTYFISDIHLGSPAHPAPRELEQTLCAWCDAITPNAERLYLLGDIFDFWYEYRDVVPKGFIRFLGALAKLSDLGVEIHFLIGNHDVWCLDYFSKELDVIMHYNAFEVTLNGKVFRLAHGDEEYRSHSFGEDFLYRIFRNSMARTLLSAIHPRWVLPLGLKSSRKSRHHKQIQKEKDLDKDNWLYECTLKMIPSMPQVDYYVYGHRHQLKEINMGHGRKMCILGDWGRFNSYGVWDGQEFRLYQGVSLQNPLGEPYPSKTR